MSSLSKDDFKQSIFSISDKNLLLCTDGFYSLLEKEPLLFFEIMNTGAESTIKKRISSIIKDKNTDDSTFILIK